jgi:type I restriction enzyme M protein
MLTLPSNMFYTVTLPATLWFFDNSKKDKNILFIDSRNIFTQIDRAHREFSEEQIQNIAIISHLHKGESHKFVQLIDRYFQQGMDKLTENKTRVEPVSEQLLEVLDDKDGKQSVAELVKQWSGLKSLQNKHSMYLEKHGKESSIEKKNKAQRQLRETFDPFFASLHEGLKKLDKIVRHHEKQQAEEAGANGKRTAIDRRTKSLKTALEALHSEVKNAETYYKHIQWLQERFPEAEYEDVTGLCKSAMTDEVKEQDYSLNPGRYVGVVIEEDGKTEEEFVADLIIRQDALSQLNEQAVSIASVIKKNLSNLVRE